MPAVCADPPVHRYGSTFGASTTAPPPALVERKVVDLARDGDDLVVTVASGRRLLTLLAGIARRRVAGARVVGGVNSR